MALRGRVERRLSTAQASYACNFDKHDCRMLQGDKDDESNEQPIRVMTDFERLAEETILSSTHEVSIGISRELDFTAK